MVLAGLVLAPAAYGADPLVGRWRYGDGEVKVTFANGSYTGVVTESTRVADGSLLLAHTLAGRTELTALAATRVLRQTARELRVAVEAARTDAPGCAAGSAGTLTLRTSSTDEVTARSAAARSRGAPGRG